ncbi:portal protein [Candidatus Magnetobacterium casense]|uniref:Portal protein n=1 Tax=Candidatus Magnetobacterium casense TaxID=1455061 RepID=A0ABS6RUZ7_9BACT|nr:portal protein [Candidatus Magnetobacterium casensis]MBV6340455.1 hypothetical protein [Candidatus Magnetobacterium casensis]
MARKKNRYTGKEDPLAIARERFRTINTAETPIRANALENLRFVYNVDGGQWPEKIREERQNDSRPCLTSNKLRKYVAQVVNRERDQRVVGKVRPVDDKGDLQRAAIIEGLIRQIEYQSNAQEVYTTAGEAAVAGGFGYWQIITKESTDSFSQEILLKKIENQFSVYLDPRGEFAFIREGMTCKEFKDRYPDKLEDDFDLSGVGDEYTLWYESDKIFIADYYFKEYYDKKIALIVDGTGNSKIVELTDEITPEILSFNGYSILKEKTVKAPKVKWQRITGHDILEEGEWVGDDIPIIEVYGDKFNIGGKQYKNALVNDAKDPQRAYNFWLTSMTETVALAPKSPYLVTPQEIKGHEQQWNDANKKNYAYLLVNQQGTNSKPRREPPPQIPTGAAQMLQLSAADIQDTIGMYQASFGERSNERTGVAIRERAGRSEFGTYHFGDNFKRAVLASTKQLINIIPKIYDDERIIRILGEDGNDELVKINETTVNLETGEELIVNDLTVGKYDVVAEVGMYSTRRQEAVEMMTSLMQASPNISPLMLDLVFKYADWPGAQEIKERLNKNMNALLGGKGGEATMDSTGGQTPTETF